MSGLSVAGRRGVACAALCALPLLAGAAAPPPVAATALDQDVQQLKNQVLTIERDAQTLEDDYLYPPYKRLSVYLGVQVPGLLVRDVAVSIDGGDSDRHQYSEIEAITLQDGGLHRVLKENVTPGAHRIRVWFTAQYADARPSDPPFRGYYEGYFNKGREPAELEFDIVREGVLAKPTLRFLDWRAAR
ncbi:MAG: hypothetical protein QJR02_00660 [Sinobacteraceae bacterium]|nr:hypothetical protein [Nevskiaceae bacterium]